METLGQKSKLDQLFKCITIGDVCVGKSCLLLRFTDQKFPSNIKPTVYIEARQRTINVDDKVTNLQIWDSAGQETFRAFTRSFYRASAAAFLVYDITRKETFDHVAMWLEDAKELAPANLTIVLVGNKCDLSHRRAVSYEEGQAFAKEHGLLFMESSAKTNYNVEEAFFLAARTVSKKMEDGVLDLSAKYGGVKLVLHVPSESGSDAGFFQGGCCN